jgi:hypothetical protein
MRPRDDQVEDMEEARLLPLDPVTEVAYEAISRTVEVAAEHAFLKR